VDDLVAEGLKNLGNVAVERGELQTAAEFYHSSGQLYERLEDIVGLADLHSNLGIIHRRSGRWDEALAEYEAALVLRERIGHLLGIGTCHNNIAEVHRTRGEPAQAIPAYQRAIETWGSIGHALFVGLALVGLGAARTESGEWAQGRADLLDAEARFAAIGSTIYLPDLYRYLASAELAAGDLEAAEQATARSLDYARAGTARHQEAATLRVMAEIKLARNEPEAATALLRISRETLMRVGDTQELARTEAVLKRIVQGT
jgi:tetratricopeptide (TPR) repeat protein